MRFLKRRVSPQTAPTEPRSRRLVLIRWLYLVSVAALAIWLGNLFFGDRVFLRSEGLVLGEPAIVAAEFPVTVRDILIREGQNVEAGGTAAIVSSQSVVESIAKLSADIATRAIRQSELHIRSQVIDTLLPLAEHRQKVATSSRAEQETLLDKRYLSLNQHTAALDNEYRGVQDFETLKSEKRAIESELASLDATLAEARAAVADLRRIYNQGQLASPIDGIVTRLVANKGSVVRSGEPLIELTGNQRFVLAYVPTGALYDVKVGDEVRIKTGLQTRRGVITRVEAMAAALPREFQRAFTPVERQQVIRIEFMPGEGPPPLFSKVAIRSANVLPQFVTQVGEKVAGQKIARLFARS